MPLFTGYDDLVLSNRYETVGQLNADGLEELHNHRDAFLTLFEQMKQSGGSAIVVQTLLIETMLARLFLADPRFRRTPHM